MTTELNLEQKLANLLDTRDFHPEMLGKDGRPANTEKAKTFSFDYISGSGKNYGTMVVVLGSENEMFIMYGDNLGKTIEDSDDRSEFFDFQQQLMDLANRNRWRGTLMDISKLKRVQAGIAAIKEGLFEGYYGTSRISYTGEATEARLMIRHNRTLGENDARFRYVESVFIETADGERFKLPFTNMGGARAMLEHVRQGGKPYDIRGSHICEMITEMKVLSRFNRAAAARVMEGVTQQIVEQAQHYYAKLRENIKQLSSSRGYNQYFEIWHPLNIQEQESLVEDIKTMFIEQTLDTRIEAALPILARIQQQGNDMKEVEIFETWVNRMTEGTWNLPETPEQVSKLKELMSKELIVGPDATNATEQLYDLVGDDKLFDRLSDLARRDPRANAWNDTEIMDRLRELGIDTSQQQPAGVEQPAAAAEPAAQSTPPLAQQQPVAEDTDILKAILKNAGVPVKENVILDETGETLRHIMGRFKKEVRDFQRGAEIDSDLYEALFDYYASKGEMPYGVAKARTGDPVQWVSDRFDRDLGGLGFRGIAEADPVQSFEDHSEMVLGKGACNKTMEGEYCPEHGLAECGYMESMGGTVAGAVAPMVGEQDIAEASYIDGRKQSDDELVWKQTSLSLADAAAKYGKKNAKIDGKNRMGKPIVVVKVPLASKQGVAEALDPMKKQRLQDLIDQYTDATDPEYMGDDDSEDIIAQIRAEFGDRTADSVAYGPSMHFPRPGHVMGHDDLEFKQMRKNLSPNRITKAGKLHKQDSDAMKRDIKSRYGQQDVAEGFASPELEDKVRARLRELEELDPDNMYQIVADEFDMTEDDLRAALYDEVDEEQGVAEGVNPRDLSKISTAKLQAYWDRHKDESGISPVFGQQLRAVAKELARRKKQGVAEGQNINEAYINSTKDAVNVLANLRQIAKHIEIGSPYNGNLANKYANDVWDVYSWLENRADVYNPQLKAILNDVFAVRKQAKELETGGNSGQNRQFANQIVNTLYPLMQWIQMNVSDQQSVAEGNDDPMNYNAAVTGSYYESQDQLARIKELALRR